MRIAIVNDLALAREVLRRVVESVPGYLVAWTAADGAEAVRKAAADRPDVILMDLIMPVMDGAEATRRIMAATPCPILIVTASLGANYSKVYEALGGGGLDAVKTPTFGPGGAIRGGDALVQRLAKLGRAQASPAASSCPAATTRPAVSASPIPLPPMLAIGASTGGPEAVAQVLAALGPKVPGPVIVVQHIAADFSGGFATWLQGRSGLPARLARDGDVPAPGQVHVAGSDDHLILRPDQRFAYTVEPRTCPYRPSVDALFGSLASTWAGPGVAVLLTGMGSDGAAGLRTLRQGGWHTIAQDQASCVVYGMPRAAAEMNAAVQVLSLPEIGPAIKAKLESLARATSRLGG